MKGASEHLAAVPAAGLLGLDPMYRMPIHFGPAPGPRNVPHDRQRTRYVHTRAALSVTALSDHQALTELLPPGCSLAGEPLLTVMVTRLTNLGWLAGRGYNIVAVFLSDVVFAGAKETVTGAFYPVVWESRTDPIITGREELGMSKIFADIPDPRITNGRHECSASWDGFRFLELEASELVETESPPKAQPPLLCKYIPRTGEWGAADVNYMTVTGKDPLEPLTHVHENRVGTGRFRFNAATWEQMPTQYLIVRHLARLPLIVRVTGLSYIAFSVPDLDRTREFMLDFGLTVVEHPDRDTLYMTGKSTPFLYKAVKGEPRFLSFGLTVANPDILDRLASTTGIASRPLDAPAGGRYVRSTDPDGYLVDVVAGQDDHVPASADGEIWNSLKQRARVSIAKRVVQKPAHVSHLAHCVLGVTNFKTSEAWYKSHFGFLTSDANEEEAGDLTGAFKGPPTFGHAAFEVRDLDDLMAGHNYLESRGHKPAWGVGRHVLGSQVFDYWSDPWGNTLEHQTDGDVFTSQDPSTTTPKHRLREVQWGQAFPAEGLGPKEKQRQ